MTRRRLTELKNRNNSVNIVNDGEDEEEEEYYDDDEEDQEEIKIYETKKSNQPKRENMPSKVIEI